MKRDQFEQQPATFPTDSDVRHEGGAPMRDAKSKVRRTRFEDTQRAATNAFAKDDANG